MDEYLIQGGKRLEGAVEISGAKNSALKLMAASLLARGVTVLDNVPRIADVLTMVEMLEHLGARVTFTGNVMTIDTSGELGGEAPYELVRRMRASINVLGPLLARRGHARVALPGGCNIGSRPIDLHEQGLRKLGVSFTFDHGYVEGVAPELTGGRVVLDFPSRGATENILTTAVMARGTTVIENAARESDIEDLGTFLNQMGARVVGAGTSTIEIDGVDDLSPASYRVSSDPIESGTFALAVLCSRGDAELIGARAGNLRVFLEKLSESGASFEETDAGLRVSISGRARPVDFATLPYPGFPTDLQPQMVAYLATADGTSIATENMFESRFMYVSELLRMGADIRTEGHHAVVRGVPELQGAPVRATDLRAGAALVLGSLGATGETIVSDVHHIDRGYEDFAGRLRSLGAEIERVASALPVGVPD